MKFRPFYAKFQILAMSLINAAAVKFKKSHASGAGKI